MSPVAERDEALVQVLRLQRRVHQLEEGIARAVALLPPGATRGSLTELIPGVRIPNSLEILSPGRYSAEALRRRAELREKLERGQL